MAAALISLDPGRVLLQHFLFFRMTWATRARRRKKIVMITGVCELVLWMEWIQAAKSLDEEEVVLSGADAPRFIRSFYVSFSLSLYFSALLQLSPSLWSDRPITRKIGAVTVMDQCGPSPAATSVPCFVNCRELQFLSLLSFWCCLWMSFLEQSQSVWSLVGWLSLALVEFVWDWKMLLLLM